jgi:hypothetical protein
MGHNYNGRLLALPANIRLGWKRMAVANTLAYYNTAKVTPVKVSITDPRDQCYKTLFRNIPMFVIG